MSSTVEEIEKFRVRALKSLELTGLLQYDEIDLICRICSCLNEPNVKLIERVVHRKGVPFCDKLLEDTLLTLEGGGQRKSDGSLRSPGGVFLNILKSRCTKAEIKFIWSEQARRQRERKRARKADVKKGSRKRRAIALSQQAVELDNSKRYQEAFDCYVRALDQWALVCKYQKNPVLRERFVTKMKEYVERAECLKQMLKTKLIDCEEKRGSSDTYSTEQVDTLLNIKRPSVRWSDIAGLNAAKESLQEAVVLPIRFPNVFTGALKPWRGILLYGPPGTGKTYLAQACATEIDATFISISSSDVMSKWQGESEKFIKSLFKAASDRAPCVIFVDEIDSMCSARNDSDNDSTRRVKTEFLVQMQGVSDSAEGVLVLAATNLPWALDSAIIRRFDRRIYIPLPDMVTRRALLDISLKGCATELREADLDEIAKLTEGYSGSDINVLVRDARMQPLRQCKDASHFKEVKKGSDVYYTPCAPDDPDKSKRECGMMSIEPNRLFLPPLTRSDFLSILKRSKPSLAPSDIAAYEDWTLKYGQQG